MKMLWTGSDSLFLVKYPPSLKRKYIYMFCLRLYARLSDFFVQEHYAESNRIRDNLIRFGLKKPIRMFLDMLYHPEAYPKKEHDGFNVLYYFPTTTQNYPFNAWLYGYDIYCELVKLPLGVNWVVIDGTQDMAEVFPVIDFYIRPTRHDGAARLIRECQINKIPYYWSEDGKPTVEVIESIILRARTED